MIGGGGSADAMKKSYDSNRKLIPKRRSLKEISGIYSNKKGKKPEYNEASPAELEKLKIQLAEEKRKSNMKIALVMAITIFCVCTTAFLFLFVFKF